MTTLRFGYGTNGFANHRLGDALAVIADLGYSGVALTLDHNHLDPYADDLPRQVAKLARRLDELGLAVVVETGARYLLDPWRRHAPTLVSNDGRERRVDLLVRAVRIAADLDAEAVSLWSGTKPPELPDADAWERLVAGCSQVMEAADALGVPLGFEPEPGMFIEDLDGFDRLLGLLGAPERFGITLDVGHCRCLERTSVPDCVRRAAPRLVNVQIDDMRRGVHQHLEFGTGEIDFPPVLAVLAEVSYRGLVAVELPRHSHVAPDVARRSLEFLRSASPRSGEGGRMRLDAVRTALAGRLSADGEQWLRQSVGRIEASAPAIRSLFPAAGRRCGRGPLDASPPADPETLRGWTVDAAARVVLLGALPLAGPALAEEIAQLYRYGDAAEKLAVLRGLALLDASHGLGEAGLPIVWDALRTNDTRLVAAALGPYGAKHLDASAYRQGVLKCVFMGIPLADISGLDRRSDDELARMLQAFAEERIAAGRPVPADVWLIVPRTPDLEPTED